VSDRILDRPPPGPVSYQHLFRLSDHGGLYEHARLAEPRPEHGYCIDDIARGLVVVAREPNPDDQLRELAEFYLWLVTDAQSADGRFHNRRDLHLTWTDEPSLEDCWGRALWGLGTAAHRLDADSSALALMHFDRSVERRSPDLRAMAFAALGAAEVLVRRPDHLGARRLLADAAEQIMVETDWAGPWPWPEPRLRYANATVPEVLLAAGDLLGDDAASAAGLRMLDWLLEVETAGGHLSITPVGGWGPGDPRPGFDQQPIEVAALADACARALETTGASRWADGLVMCEAWFLGANDTGVSLLDAITGGGCDGLMLHGRNENQGAESTLALIATFQRAQELRTPRW
jgi:hypothetical protein